MKQPSLLALSDGALFYGTTTGPSKTVCGEVVFNTSMTGYQEICTDPSYEGQIILFTTSHVGNVGIHKGDFESTVPRIKGLLAREISHTPSHPESEQSLPDFLDHHAIPWIEGLDTRSIARHLQTGGTLSGCIMSGHLSPDLAVQRAKSHHEAFFTPSTRPPQGTGALRVCIYDFGIKTSIIQALLAVGCSLSFVSSSLSAADVLATCPDALLLSNGPGDPASMQREIKEISSLLQTRLPTVGICLGCQLLALAAGGTTKKMPFGHRGANHPVIELATKKVTITSQNHSFVVDSLPPTFEVTHTSLLDGSIQGIHAKGLPIFGFQGHPEGGPGPTDIQSFFVHLFTETSCAT